MELLCSPRALPRLPHLRRPVSPAVLPRSVAAAPSPATFAKGSAARWVRAMAFEETSTFVPDRFEAKKEEEKEEEEEEKEEAAHEGFLQEEAPAPPVGGGQSVAFDFLENFDLKKLQLDSEDAYNSLIYGAGALLALWLLSAVVRALDSLPLFPKLMEVVGLGFTVWFSYRYLIFKKNRNELFEKIEDLKEQIIGRSDE